MTIDEAITFVQEKGVVLASGKGPVPRLTEAIVGEPVRGSWWAHPKSRQIFAVLQGVTDSEDVLVCRLVERKITLVHRRLWPALVRLAKRFPPDRIAQVHQEHTASGHHIAREVPFPKWVPVDVQDRAREMSEKAAIASLGPWAQTAFSRSGHK